MRVFPSAFLSAATLSMVALVAWALPPGTNDEIAARLLPNGSVCKAGDDCGTVAAASAGGTGLSGEAIYNQFCFACHAAGVAGAPLFSDRGQWEPRIAKGMDTLWQSTVNGLPPGMPAKGTCMSCSDDELKTAVEFMVDAAK